MPMSIIALEQPPLAADWRGSMPFIPTLNCVQATIDYTGPGSVVAQNRLYCATASVPTETDLTDIATDILTWASENWAGAANDLWQISGITCRAMNEEEGINFVQTADLPILGLVGTGTGVPNQVTATVTLNTGLVGRSARGRIYIVGLAEGIIDHTRLTDIGQAQWQVVYEGLFTILETDGHNLQVVSFVEDGIPRAAGRMLPVTSVNVRFPLATQRRRLS